MKRISEIPIEKFETEDLLASAERLGTKIADIPFADESETEVDWFYPISPKGPGTNVNVKIPDDDTRMMDSIIQMRETPFKTRTDLIRSALYWFVKCFQRHYQLKNPKLMEVMNSQLMRAESEELIRRVEDLHESAVALRNDLVMHLVRDERNAAWLKLRQYYDRVIQFDPTTADRYLRVIYELPIAQMFAFSMREWSDRIPDEFIPEEEPYDMATPVDFFMRDEGIPPSAKMWREMDGIRKGVDRRTYMRDYMRNRRREEREKREMRED